VKVFLAPTGLCEHARAFQRISAALARYAPPSVTITADRCAADLVVLYVIGPDALQAGRDLFAAGKRYIAVQCCWRSTGVGDDDWLPFWHDADLVMSYYALPAVDGGGESRFTFYHAPLGIDEVFTREYPLVEREPLVVTTGYVDGAQAEAISEVWEAAAVAGLKCFHVGPHKVEGMERLPVGWTSKEGVSDEELAKLYHRALVVSGLRHVEGFELPCAEGLACGARPLLFSPYTQPAMRHWYDGHSYRVPESSGDELVATLVDVLSAAKVDDWPVTAEERARVLRRFDWATVCRGFWERVCA